MHPPIGSRDDRPSGRLKKGLPKSIQQQATNQPAESPRRGRGATRSAESLSLSNSRVIKRESARIYPVPSEGDFGNLNTPVMGSWLRGGIAKNSLIPNPYIASTCTQLCMSFPFFLFRLILHYWG